MHQLRVKIPETVRAGFIFLVILSAIEFWSFRAFDEKKYEMLKLGISLVLVVFVLFNLNVFSRKLFFKQDVLILFLLPVLSVIGAGIFHDQSMKLSFWMYRAFLFWLFYFVLHILDVPPQRIIHMLLFVGAVWVFLTAIQQFTYPNYYFYTRDDKGDQEILRAGIYRYFVSGQGYGLFFLLYSFYTYLTKKKTFYLAFVFFALVGFYYTGTRQAMVAAAGCMFLATFLLEGAAKWKYIFVFVAGFFLVALFGAFLFTEIVEMTQNEVDNDDYVRYLAADFFLNDYWPHWGAKLLGNGPAHIDTAYGQEMEYLKKAIGLYRSDVGIIGAYNELGAFFVIAIVVTCVRAIFMKIKRPEGRYLKLFFFNALSLLILNQAFTSSGGMVFYSILFFLADKAMQKEEEPVQKHTSIKWPRRRTLVSHI